MVWKCVKHLVLSCVSDSRRGFGLDIGFTDHFNTQLVITLNYKRRGHACASLLSLPASQH
jgi:hypothetical protein